LKYAFKSSISLKIRAQILIKLAKQFLNELKITGKLFDPPRTWISLNKLGQPNYTQWANGEPLTYSDWGPGNPAQFSSENCAAFE